MTKFSEIKEEYCEDGSYLNFYLFCQPQFRSQITRLFCRLQFRCDFYEDIQTLFAMRWRNLVCKCHTGESVSINEESDLKINAQSHLNTMHTHSHTCTSHIKTQIYTSTHAHKHVQTKSHPYRNMYIRSNVWS